MAAHTTHEGGLEVFAPVRWTSRPDFGIGRVVGLSTEAGTTRFAVLTAPGAEPEEYDVPTGELEPIHYENGHRLYVSMDKTLRAGRGIEDPDLLLDPEPWPDTEGPGTGRLEIIGLTGGTKMHVPRSHIIPLSGEAIRDPAHILAAQITEGRWWYRKRRVIRDLAIEQRHAYAGVASLASSAIEIEEHQFRIARRVLHDPVCRYVLADEVGLGKTIEAGIVLRQHVLESDTSLDAIVVVPPHLVDQWDGELRSKFGLGLAIDQGRIALMTLEEVGTAPRLGELEDGMLIVDEAHHTSTMAFSPEHANAEVFRRLATVSHSASRVLLLSATPVLRHEDGFLAMLHLLDPASYALDDLDGFRRRIRDRQPIGELVRALDGRIPRLLVAPTAAKLRALFPGDDLLADLIDQFEDADRESRTGVQFRLSRRIRRAHRLYDRLIRTRRSDPLVSGALPTREARSVTYSSESAAEVEDVLETWRDVALASIPEDLFEHAAQMFSGWVQAFLEDPRELVRLWGARFEQIRDGEATSLFEEEPQVLEVGLDIDCSSFVADLGAAIRAVLHEGRRHRLICFVSSEALCDELAQQVGGQCAVCRPETSLEQYHRVVLVPRRFEEGLNLQQEPAELIHADLPMSQTRIEQRIGRVDRFGGNQLSVRSTVLLQGSNYQSAWYNAVAESGGAFDSSVSNVQYLLAEAERLANSELLEYGPEAFARMAQRLAEGEGPLSLQAEGNRMLEQDLLDTTGFGRHRDAEIFDRLEEHEFGDHAGQFALAVYSWAVTGLGFKALDKDGDGFGSSTSRAPPENYPFQFLIRDRLLPRSQIANHLVRGLVPSQRSRRSKTKRFWKSIWSTLGRTPDPELAGSRAPVPLRIGHPIVDGLLASMEADDRGRGFTRVIESATSLPAGVFFCFEFIAELRSAVTAATDRRVADGHFPPRVLRIWLDSEGAECTEPVAKQLNDIALNDYPGVSSIRSDEQWGLAEETLGADWESTTLRLRNRAQEVLTTNEDWTLSIETATRTITEDLEDAHEHLVDRMSADSAHNADTRALEQEITLLVDMTEAVATVSPRLDALGCVVVPARNQA
jgi:ATP-dependent helicase HepA